MPSKSTASSSPLCSSTRSSATRTVFLRRSSFSSAPRTHLFRSSSTSANAVREFPYAIYTVFGAHLLPAQSRARLVKSLQHFAVDHRLAKTISLLVAASGGAVDEFKSAGVVEIEAKAAQFDPKALSSLPAPAAGGDVEIVTGRACTGKSFHCEKKLESDQNPASFMRHSFTDSCSVYDMMDVMKDIDEMHHKTQGANARVHLDICEYAWGDDIAGMREEQSRKKKQADQKQGATTYQHQSTITAISPSKASLLTVTRSLFALLWLGVVSDDDSGLAVCTPARPGQKIILEIPVEISGELQPDVALKTDDDCFNRLLSVFPLANSIARDKTTILSQDSVIDRFDFTRTPAGRNAYFVAYVMSFIGNPQKLYNACKSLAGPGSERSINVEFEATPQTVNRALSKPAISSRAASSILARSARATPFCSTGSPSRSAASATSPKKIRHSLNGSTSATTPVRCAHETLLQIRRALRQRNHRPHSRGSDVAGLALRRHRHQDTQAHRHHHDPVWRWRHSSASLLIRKFIARCSSRIPENLRLCHQARVEADE